MQHPVMVRVLLMNSGEEKPALSWAATEACPLASIVYFSVCVWVWKSRESHGVSGPGPSVTQSVDASVWSEGWGQNETLLFRNMTIPAFHGSASLWYKQCFPVRQIYLLSSNVYSTLLHAPQTNRSGAANRNSCCWCQSTLYLPPSHRW